MAGTLLTIGTVAQHFDVAAWKVRRLYERGILPEPARVGRYRIIPANDLPRIEAALRKCGYLTPRGCAS
jgi:DNA-binding transcriptional MerR regulator